MLRLLFVVFIFLPISTFAFPILQGLTGKTHTQFAILIPKDVSPIFVVQDRGTQEYIEPVYAISKTEDFVIYNAVKVFFKNLKLGHDYALKIVDESGTVLDERFFRTLDTDKSDFKAITISCTYDGFHKPNLWKELANKKPDILFFGGDNVYADRISLPEARPADLKQAWKRYIDTRTKLEVFKFKQLIPTLATWDDHDFGTNDGDRDYIHKKETLEVFNIFYAQDPVYDLNYESGPGVSHMWKAFNQVFFLLDNRYFRSPEDVSANEETHFGLEQEMWLFLNLVKNQSLTWLISGDQFFGAYDIDGESYEGDQPQSFKGFLSSLSNVPAPVLFFSGDKHYSEVMAIEPDILGYSTFEITSSSLHSAVVPGEDNRHKNPRRIKSVNKMNYTVIEAKNRGLNTDLIITSYGPDNKVFYQIPASL